MSVPPVRDLVTIEVIPDVAKFWCDLAIPEPAMSSTHHREPLKPQQDRGDLDKDISEILGKLEQFFHAEEMLEKSERLGVTTPPTSASTVTETLPSEAPSSHSDSERSSCSRKSIVDQVFEELGEAVPVELLETIHRNGLLSKIPRDEDGRLTSIGSIEHDPESGVEYCKPCVFWFRTRCNKGIFCEYCHFRHVGQKAKRIRKSKRLAARRAVSWVS
eukprot:gnl/MRDRNA2_/MRDRNA2_14867_c0_seq1.p1 gnl/MRDRNA2_/MRDRNA2_14867_c0~~gnl/MRDRNA2_/MRDRNA2_14867_c0_seq1.p1  ORF type:complete len:217 (+),score=39.79 gnl/MRDRNA2_/MRDRNA2_14867_c0_seq1:91-741(+)